MSDSEEEFDAAPTTARELSSREPSEESEQECAPASAQHSQHRRRKKRPAASKETLEKSAAAKFAIEQHYENFFRTLREREERSTKNFPHSEFNVVCRRKLLEQEMEEANLPEERREKYRMQLYSKETEFLRLSRTRFSERSFTTIKVIGRGAFGEVSHCLIVAAVSPSEPCFCLG